MPDVEIDDAIDRVVAQRAMSADPGDLVEEIRAAVSRVDQRSRRLGRWWWPMPGDRLAAAIGFAALVAALLVGTTLVRNRPALPGAGANATASSSVSQFTCNPRSYPYRSGPLDLTGSWWDGANLYFLRSIGQTVWGVALNGPEPTYADVSEVGPYLILHGTITGTRVQVDWASAGERYPGEQRFSHYQDMSGSLTWQIGTSNNGNVQLVTTNESGSDLAGPAYQLPILRACTPTG